MGVQRSCGYLPLVLGGQYNLTPVQNWEAARRLFGPKDLVPLLKMVLPLCNNDRRAELLQLMPSCDGKGARPDWMPLPTDVVAQMRRDL